MFVHSRWSLSWVLSRILLLDILTTYVVTIVNQYDCLIVEKRES